MEETNTPGQDTGLGRGIKRKYAGDGDRPDIRHFNRHHIPVQPVVAGQDTSPPDFTEHSIANGRLPPESSVVSRDDGYYKTLYTTRLDFRLLGQLDPEFEAVLERRSCLDFANPKSVMQLTKTLLKLDFGLQVDLPMDRLCPPVPNRHNYILWLKDLLDSSAPSRLGLGEQARPVVGLDVGTGASLIYPLLACVQRPSWSFIATDVDAKSLEYARKNARLNNLQSRIRVVDRSSTDRLIPLDELGLGTIDFVMVNPPFYASEAELEDLARQKSRPPNSACTGAPVEMVCAGGEVGFVRRMIDESLNLTERVQWYTCMLGKQSSLEVLVGILKDRGVTNYAVTAFVQGSKTRRWAIGWSFGDRKPSLSASRGCEPSAGKKILPKPTEAIVATRPVQRSKREQLERIVRDMMESLDLTSWIWDQQLSRGAGFVDGNVWGRAYRRKKEREKGNATSIGGDATEDKPSPSRQQQLGRHPERDIVRRVFGFSIAVQVLRGVDKNEEKVAVVARWLQGNDYTIFESFTGFLRKAIPSYESRSNEV